MIDTLESRNHNSKWGEVPCWHWPPSIAGDDLQFGMLHGRGAMLSLVQQVAHAAAGRRHEMDYPWPTRNRAYGLLRTALLYTISCSEGSTSLSASS